MTHENTNLFTDHRNNETKIEMKTFALHNAKYARSMDASCLIIKHGQHIVHAKANDCIDVYEY